MSLNLAIMPREQQKNNICCAKVERARDDHTVTSWRNPLWCYSKSTRLRPRIKRVRNTVVL